ncbi:hypothetical protein ABE55_07735 [Bacillus thuringiensis]|uniref:hypothetical protein n=1 Tax=Bacillus cereus group TaxID=86661 RepID=UPI000BF0A140|nr:MULTISPECIES: hypothetical protein [Bacillus cereus group]MBG9466431.1 hypothetical protein [Bacillus thuringiensis]MBJ7965575.1 hypothetical protein [Bacillus cereus]MBJ8001829.1 hypothetical protein [Bacillus cereus]MCU5319134.1 hypothetical protein [Bacillus cereus]MEC0035575.1 hypothetical protein [Bacillus cereus]
MIGYDRPLRAEWIYELHKNWKPDMLISDFNSIFDSIAWQVSGKEARRKARTNIVRYFIGCTGKGTARKTLEHDPLVKLSVSCPFEKIKPLYLTIILTRVEVIQKIVELMSSRYEIGDTIQVSKFITHIKREYGDRDVIRRSVSSFFKTLYYFGVFETAQPENHKEYRFVNKLKLGEDIFPYFIKELFVTGKDRKQITLDEILCEDSMMFFEMEELKILLNRFNGEHWFISNKFGDFKITFK